MITSRHSNREDANKKILLDTQTKRIAGTSELLEESWLYPEQSKYNIITQGEKLPVSKADQKFD